jgi:hypothetical protein
VKTTPNPRATKNSKGELVPPPPPPPPPPLLVLVLDEESGTVLVAEVPTRVEAGLVMDDGPIDVGVPVAVLMAELMVDETIAVVDSLVWRATTLATA